MSGRASALAAQRVPEPYKHSRPSIDARAAFALARAEFESLGVVQRRALVTCPNEPVVGLEQAEGVVFPRRVRCSLQLRGIFAAGERWEMTAWGALVREAGASPTR